MGHPRILPPEYFQNLTVEAGGVGAGTVITFQMKVLGHLASSRARITEPEPGRVLVETVDEQNIVTTFRVEPASAAASVVTISSAVPTRTGIMGAIERWFMPRFLGKVFRAELTLLDRVARDQT